MHASISIIICAFSTGCVAIHVLYILPALRPVLTDTKCSRIRDRADNTSRVDELILNLLILLSKKNRHFGAFCTALEQNGYKHWAGKLQYKADEIEG